MFKKLMILTAAVLLPLFAASAVAAAPAQYPPSAGGGGVAGGGQSADGNGTTLARTGSNTGPMVLVGVALVTVGGVALVTSRRLRTDS
jgi:LPXTG-motif cell wall-anchored protein